MKSRFGICDATARIYAFIITAIAIMAFAAIPGGATFAQMTGSAIATTPQPQLIDQTGAEPSANSILLMVTRGLTASDIDLSDTRLMAALQTAHVANMRTNTAAQTMDPLESGKVLAPLFDASDVVDLGSITTDPADEQHAAQVANVLATFLNTLDGLNTAEYEHIVLASTADATTAARLQFVATWYTDSNQSGMLGSTATHTDGLIGLEDLNHVPSAAFSTGFGALHEVPTENIDAAIRLLQQQQRHAETAALASPWWFTFYGVTALIGVLATLAHFLRRPAPPGEPRGGPTFIWRNLAWWNTVVFALIPSAILMNLIPWWNYPLARITPFAISLLIAIVITALMSQTDHPASMVGALTLFLVGADVVAGKGWANDSVLGPLTMTFRRFYGVTNRMYIILIVAGLLTVLPWLMTQRSQPRNAARGILGIGAIVLALDALTQL
ncbi:MAG: hypothetical protein Q4P05_06970, partial [Actinomycetaceae bacterium]|nr:hypothetical protein [Actinomycetaceae bacterium]